MAIDPAQQIIQLEEARKHVLADAHHYQAIIPGILPIVGPNAHLDVRRWGADFLAEGFASPALSVSAKEPLSVTALPMLREWLATPMQDDAVVKSAIQAAASVYGLVFRYTSKNPHDSQPWEHMSAIKASILKRWDSASTGIQLCCIKFVQRVVHAQTPGVIADPRRPDLSEISLVIVPRDHPLIPPSHLEAEASGLLDRLLDVFYQENSDPVLVDATLNCLALLVRTRQSTANKIVTAILNYNPLKQVKAATMGPRERIVYRSLERNTRIFLMNIVRRSEFSPFAARIKAHIDRLVALQMEIFDENARKRGAPDGAEGPEAAAKRARLNAGLRGPGTAPPPLPPGPVTATQLYTLTGDSALQGFDVTPIPLDLVVRITLAVLQHIDSIQLDDALNVVRSRFMELSRRPLLQQQASTAEADDDYEPELEEAEDAEQVLNKLDAAAPDEAAAADARAAAELALGAFRLPQPPPLTKVDATTLGGGCVTRVLGLMRQAEEPDRTPKPGLQRLAGSRYDREAWVTILTRLATRGSPDIGNNKKRMEDEDADGERQVVWEDERTFADGIRETLWRYVIDDFRHRIDVAIAWLNEEWYNDKITTRWAAAQASQEIVNGAAPATGAANYEKWTLRLLDAIIPYLDAGDKLLVRFLGEIPEVDTAIVGRVQAMARDPDRISLTVKALYYLVAFKPPAKTLAIDALESIWRNYAGAKAFVRPYLAKVRPAVLEEEAPPPTPKSERAERRESEAGSETLASAAPATVAMDASMSTPKSPSMGAVASPSTVTAAG